MFKDQPLKTRKLLVEAMVARMAQAYGIQKKELPTFLDCQKSLVNNWVFYGRIPYDYLDQCHHKTGVSMDWLLYGEKPKFEISPEQLAQLNPTIESVITDGFEFKIISENYAGAGKQLTGKLEIDLLKWLGIEATPPADPAAVKDAES
jgi:hypothetical protein